ACGVPVVMTDDGGSREYVELGKNALVVPVKDRVALRDAAQQLLSDRDLRMRCIENGLATAAQFSWPSITNRFSAYLEERFRRTTFTEEKLSLDRAIAQ